MTHPTTRALCTRAVTALAAATATTAAHADRTAPQRERPQKAHFDLQAHRGGIGMTTEETPQGFAKALELGVTTLELDTQITKDLKVVVTHDRQVNPKQVRRHRPGQARRPRSTPTRARTSRTSRSRRSRRSTAAGSSYRASPTRRSSAA